MSQSFEAFIKDVHHYPNCLSNNDLHLSVDDVQILDAAGILTRGSDLEQTLCTSCDENHLADVYVADEQHYYQCPAAIEPNPVTASMMMAWKFQMEPFLLLLGTRLQMKLGVEKLEAGDGLWQIGFFIKNDVRHCCYYYQGKNPNEAVDHIELLPRKDYRYIVFTPHPQSFKFPMSNKQTLVVDIAEMVTLKARKIVVNKTYWNKCLVHGFKIVEFNPSNGDLCVNGELIAPITPASAEYHFANILWANFNLPVSHADIGMYVVNHMGKHIEDIDGNFCYKQKSAIKAASSKPKLIHQILETTTTPNGELAIRMRNPIK
jgi:hypothetical protein